VANQTFKEEGNMKNKNLFATVLTYAAPSSNYRGESEENRTILQKISRGGKDYTIVSPESIRNALREMLIDAGLPSNRKRLHDYLDKDGKPQLAVEFKKFPDPNEYADDFLFGFMVADKEAVKKHRVSKRDSVLRMNMAVSLTPYRFNALFNQSPLNAPPSPWRNAPKSGLLHREVLHCAYQYPFALSADDCSKGKRDWTQALLKAIGELNGVAGGHARSYFEMSPSSIVCRLTPSLVAGFNTYGFDEKGAFPELGRINEDDLQGNEFWIGGELARNMAPDEKQRLTNQGVRFYDNPQKLLAEISNEFLK
jgi:CRISPR-associated protein Cst2